MRGIITIRNPIGDYLVGKINIKKKKGLQEGIKIKRVRGGWPLVADIRFPGHVDDLSIYVHRKRNGRIVDRIVFDFRKIEGTGPFQVTGKSFDTRRFVPWICICTFKLHF